MFAAVLVDGPDSERYDRRLTSQRNSDPETVVQAGHSSFFPSVALCGCVSFGFVLTFCELKEANA